MVELSIVLVILGLLTGGILAGQSLIRAAQLRAVPTEYSRWITATRSFRDKYFGLPGDIATATQFWGRMVNVTECVTNSSAAVNSSTGVCDGNADGALDIASAGSKPAELAQYWRELALAGLIEGTYSGYTGASGNRTCVIGTDCPPSKLSNAGWSTRTMTAPDDSGAAYAMDYGNMFLVGGQTPQMTNAAVMKPEEAWNIDVKMDDGKPAYGKIVARYYNNACAAADDGTTHTPTNFVASYKLTDSSTQCALYFRNAY